jgi:hypothetical protein
MYPSPELEACMLNGKSEYYCIKGELEICFNVRSRARSGERNGEVENGLKLCKSFTAVLESKLILASK